VSTRRARAYRWYPNDTTTPKFYDTASTSAACPADQLRRRAAVPLVQRTHRSCVPGITFGRLVATS
jgi:hypothetical protein